jgi:putative Ca2+/H+ antiporter (TMEM165/GDT1 family)
MARVQNLQGERIESMRFSVPALRVGVLEYGPGQLQTGNLSLDGKAILLYYPAEAVSEKGFLRSLETAPVVVGGHDATTNEQNKKIDGWASAVRYDNVTNAAIIDGIVKGNKEIDFIKNNIGIDDFGASAFIDIYGLKVQDGITPDGKQYDAIATSLRATHVALAKHVRDPENKVKVLNAVVINSLGAIKQDGKKMILTPEQITAIVENAVSKAVGEKKDGDRLDRLEKAVTSIANAVDEMKKDKEDEKKEEKKEEAEAKNEDDEKDDDKKEDKEDATLENAKPSQTIIAAFATAYNVEFGAKTPSFTTLASLAGIKEEDIALRIAAVNAKFAEISDKKATAKNKNDNKLEVF